MSLAEPSPVPPAASRIAIIGGGLAGLAAAVGLTDRGLHIELFEARRQLGGRAGSFRDPATDAWVDHCQHVSLGCCTNLTDFCRRTGLAELVRHDDTLHFFGPNGRRHDLRASPWLPAPLHLLPSLLRLSYLSLRERISIIRALQKLARASTRDDSASPTIGAWLRAHGQTERAIELFWTPVIVSALSESLDRAAVPPVRKVFIDAFLGPRRAYEIQIPRVPLGDFYGARLEQWLAQHGILLRTETSVKQIFGDASGITAIELATDQRLPFDGVILAVPLRRVAELLPPSLHAALPEPPNLDKIESAPITAVHLWFDAPLTDLPHAVLPGRLSQWVFNHGPQSRSQAATPSENAPVNESPSPQQVSTVAQTATERNAVVKLNTEGGVRGTLTITAHYYQIVISASRDLESTPREQVIAQVCDELAAIWPTARQAKLLQSRLITQQHAVFSPLPGTEQLRPRQQTSVPNLFLAGDWTATGWPATMEGAVRSGYLAAEALFVCLKQPAHLLAPDLPRPWLTRRLIKD